MRNLTLTLLLLLAFSLAACGGSEAAGSGSAAAGQKLFEQVLIGAHEGCVTCHSLEPGVVIVGPSLATIGAEAGSRVPGLSAEDYIRESIMDTNAFLVEGFAADVMPVTLADELSEQDVWDLVAYLQTLK